MAGRRRERLMKGACACSRGDFCEVMEERPVPNWGGPSAGWERRLLLSPLAKACADHDRCGGETPWLAFFLPPPPSLPRPASRLSARSLPPIARPSTSGSRACRTGGSDTIGYPLLARLPSRKLRRYPPATRPVSSTYFPVFPPTIAAFHDPPLQTSWTPIELYAARLRPSTIFGKGRSCL